MTGAGRLISHALMAVVVLALCGPVWARQSMSFVPGHHARARAAAHHARHVQRSRHAFHAARHTTGRRARHEPEAADEGSAAKAVPGPGFTMQDGVLTYPAPARFQPGNLKRR